MRSSGIEHRVLSVSLERRRGRASAVWKITSSHSNFVRAEGKGCCTCRNSSLPVSVSVSSTAILFWRFTLLVQKMLVSLEMRSLELPHLAFALENLPSPTPTPRSVRPRKLGFVPCNPKLPSIYNQRRKGLNSVFLLWK